MICLNRLVEVNMKKVILVLGLFLAIGFIGIAYAISTTVETQYQRGCCSHHGGVSHCGNSGYFICNDGSRSPSCRCR